MRRKAKVPEPISAPNEASTSVEKRQGERSEKFEQNFEGDDENEHLLSGKPMKKMKKAKSLSDKKENPSSKAKAKAQSSVVRSSHEKVENSDRGDVSKTKSGIIR